MDLDRANRGNDGGNRGNDGGLWDNGTGESGESDEDGDVIDDLYLGKKLDRKVGRGNAGMRIVKSVKGNNNLKTLKGLDKGFERRHTVGG